MWKSEEEKDFEKKFLAEIEGMAKAFEQSMKEAGNEIKRELNDSSGDKVLD